LKSTRGLKYALLKIKAFEIQILPLFQDFYALKIICLKGMFGGIRCFERKRVAEL